MKKIMVLCLALCLLTGAIVSQEKKEPIASVTMAFGEVYIKNSDKKNWEITKVGMYIYEGDKIRTKDTGKAEVMFVNGSIVFIGNDTEMEFLNKEDQTSNQNSLFLFFGSIWNKVTDGSDYNIESVHALATVRGTYFNVSIKDIMQVYVKEGKVDVENQYGKVEAEENTLVNVSKEVAPIIEDISEESFPEEITFDTDIVIETNVITQVFKQEWYKITGIVRNKDDNTLYTEPLEIIVTASDNVWFKKHKKIRKATQSLVIEPKNGRFQFLMLAKEDNENFTISSSKTVSETHYIIANDEPLKKDVLVEFWNAEGQLKRIKTTFEKQQ
ncbi:hypothetical protein CL658_05170 [bacterium]|nr:hypothetical protein [bacterium]|tara:strand:+ start:3299 stop:4282 length:984 start_codon:yes stop_codon:yes gene_type:complete